MTPPCVILFVKMKGELLMKLFIGSDIHGSSANIRRFLDIVSDARKTDPDAKVVLLGDIYNPLFSTKASTKHNQAHKQKNMFH